MADPIILSMKIPAAEISDFMANMDLVVSETHDRYFERLRFAAAAVCALDWSDNDPDAVATITDLKNALEGEADLWAKPNPGFTAEEVASVAAATIKPGWPKSDPTAVPFESVDDTVEDLKRRHPIAHHNV